MTPLEHARHILDTMLGYLQVLTDDSDALIGRRGETLDDIQYLVNRVLQRHLKDAPRIRIDVEFYRSMREDKMVARAKELGERVRATGQNADLPPMNSYYRRLVHNVFVNDPEVMSVSQDSSDVRFKRILLKRRTA
jgi:spoIIIJ-associated protein